MAIDRTSIYWVAPEGFGKTIKRAGLDGSGQTTIIEGKINPAAITVVGEHIYWVESGSVAEAITSASAGSVIRVPVTGGSGTRLFSSSAAILATTFDETGVYYATLSSNHPEPPQSAIVKVPFDGGTAAPIATIAVTFTLALTNNATALFWTQRDSQRSVESIVAMSKEGGPITVLVERGLGSALLDQAFDALAADGANVYGVERLGGPAKGVVTRIPVDGGPESIFACGQDPMSLAMDDTALYWVNTDGGVMRMDK